MEDHDQLPKLEVTFARPPGAPDRKAPLVSTSPQEPQEEQEAGE